MTCRQSTASKVAAVQPTPLPEVPAVDVIEARRRHTAGARLIDVREAVEHNALRIPGTELMPLSTIREWFTTLDPDDELLFYCRTGQRSASVVHALTDQAGFTNATNVSGGVTAWAEADLPIER